MEYYLGKKADMIRFADDISIIAERKEDVQGILNVIVSVMMEEGRMT